MDLIKHREMDMISESCELNHAELEAISGGADDSRSETFSGSGGGLVSGPAAGRTEPHNELTCPNRPWHNSYYE
jgi:hypothetical protein